MLEPLFSASSDGSLARTWEMALHAISGPMKPSTRSISFGLRIISNRPRVRVRPMSRDASDSKVGRRVLVADACKPRVERLVGVELRDAPLRVQQPRDAVDDRRIVVDHRLQIRVGECPFDHDVPQLDEPIRDAAGSVSCARSTGYQTEPRRGQVGFTPGSEHAGHLTAACCTMPRGSLSVPSGRTTRKSFAKRP